jgi:hypothetical protein
MGSGMLALLCTRRTVMSRETADCPVVTLESAPRVEWARHRSRARGDLGRLLVSWLASARWQYFCLLLSDTAYLLAREKYSAFAIDRIYADTPSGFGWLGRRLDRYVLDLPVHRAVRDRFRFVTRHLTEAIQQSLAEFLEVEVLSVPCGLVRDLTTVYQQLGRKDPDAAQRVKFYGLDLDYEGRVLEEARRRARSSGAPITFVRANALEGRTWSWLRQQVSTLSVISCIGFSPWLAPDELGMLLRCFGEHLRTSGYLLLDRFNPGRHSQMGKRAEIHAHYHSDEHVREHLEAAGLAVQMSAVLGDNEGMGYVAQKVG